MSYNTTGNATSTTLTGEGTTEQITTSAEYDFFGNLLTSVTDVAGNETTYAYASNQNKQLGAPSSVTNALNVTVDYAYDDLDRAESTSIADLSTVDYGYNAMGYLSEVSRTDEVTNYSQKYTLSYDSFGNIKDIKVGTAITLASYTYGPKNGNLSVQTYGNGDTVSYTYDNLGKVKTVSWSDGRTVTYTYNGEGSIYSISDTDSGYTYYYTYDSLGRLIDSRAVKDDATVLQTRQEYDSSNRLTKQYLNLVDKTITESYNYDTEDGKLTSMSFNFGLGNKTLTLAYDELERLESRSNPVVRADYTYIPNEESGTTTTLVESLEYTRLTGTSLPVMRFEYDYDKLGNIVEIVDPILEATKEYTYDELGQMTQEKLSYNSGTTTTYNYTYDRYGNILTGRGKSYTYGNSTWQDLLTAYDGKKIAYEGQTYTVSGDNITVSTNNPVSGNPISYYNGTRWTFGWENGRELATATNGDVSISYAYDLNGLRTTKTVDGVVHEYLYSGDKLIRYCFGNTVMEFLYDQNGAPFAMIYNGTPYYYVLNLQGDVVRLVNASGGSSGVYRYDAWGNILYESNNEYIRANPLRYRGYVYDTESGFYYLQSRYYDPQIGRFINADEVSMLGADGSLLSCNLFAYCRNNPVMGYDPAGYWDWGWEERAALGTTILIVGIALLLAAPTGGSSLAFGALALSSTTAVAAGSAMAITGTVIVGDAIAASINQAKSKGSDSGKDYQQAKGNKQANEWAQKVGYDDAEMLKKDYVGNEGSKFNMYRNRATEEIILIGIKGFLKGVEKFTGLFLK